jgi:hypothetical protein
MTVIHVFDPAMCCSTGICGPSVDPRLARLAADLAWLKDRGVTVVRSNLSHQPAAFAENRAVVEALEARGEAALPMFVVDGQVAGSGTYPTRAELVRWAHLDAACCATTSAQADPADKTGCC